MLLSEIHMISQSNEQQFQKSDNLGSPPTILLLYGFELITYLYKFQLLKDNTGISQSKKIKNNMCKVRDTQDTFFFTI